MIGLPLLVIGNVWMSVSLGLHATTGGYLVLTPRGIASVERRFVRDDTTIYLVGMVHLGQASGYDAIKARFEELDNAILLAEGVTDEQGVLAGSGGYDKVAKRLGLTVQPRADAFGVEVRRADVDVGSLSKDTQAFLRDALGVWSSDNPALAVMTVAAEYDSDAKARALLDELYENLIVTRNEVLLAAIDEASDRRNIIVPWGAGHLPGIEAGVLARGFEPEGEPIRRLLVGRE